MRFGKHSVLFAVVAILALSGMLLFPFVGRVQAANFAQAYLRLSRMTATTATGGTVCANPTTTATEADVQVTFPSAFTVNSTASNWTVNTTDIPAGSTAWVSINTATGVSGQVVTFPSGDLTPGTLYCFNFSGTNTLTTGTSGNSQTGTIATRATGPAAIDSTQYATAVVGAGADQIVVTASVPATFTFALSGNTDAFTTDLGTTTVSTSGRTLTIATNAASGWIAWVRSANAALNSSSTGASIATAGSIDGTPTDLASVTGYVLDVNATTQGAGGTGNFTIEPEYDGSNTTSGGTLSSIFQAIAVSDNPAGPTDGDVVTLIERAKISAVQPAAQDYTDTLTIVAAGRF